MKQLKNVKSLKITVSGYGKSLRNVLKTVVASWLKGCNNLGTENISILIIKDYDEIDEGLGDKKPFIYLYPNQSDCRTWIPLSGFDEPIKIFRENSYRTFTEDSQIDIIFDKIRDLMRQNKDFLTKKKEEYNTKHSEPGPKFNDIWYEAYDLEFDTDLNNSFLCISFSGYTERN